jgi:hypothetical protein
MNPGHINGKSGQDTSIRQRRQRSVTLHQYSSASVALLIRAAGAVLTNAPTVCRISAWCLLSWQRLPHRFARDATSKHRTFAEQSNNAARPPSPTKHPPFITSAVSYSPTTSRARRSRHSHTKTSHCDGTTPAASYSTPPTHPSYTFSEKPPTQHYRKIPLGQTPSTEFTVA